MTRRTCKLVLSTRARDALFADETFFGRKGIEAVVAEDGLELVEKVRSSRPDIVVVLGGASDFGSTDENDLLKADESTRSIPVVVIGGSGGSRGTRREPGADPAGADAHVPLSAGREGLLETIGELLHIPIRRSVRITVMFSVHEWPDGKEAIGRAVQLSESGMCLVVNREYEEGSDILLRFLLPHDRQEIRSRANVRWVTPTADRSYSLGLQFLEMDSDDRSRLSGYISGRLASVGV